ncbi:MAG TPA: hypothetical protein VGP44_13135 [Gemmatimonadales bacterium]|nr:hypothetical protein [Gemmatimonadales bacterium]
MTGFHGYRADHAPSGPACLLGCKDRKGTQRRTAPPLLLCKDCTERIVATLDDVVTLYSLLPVVKRPGSTGTGRPGKGKAPPVPVRLDVLVLMDARSDHLGWVDEHGDRHHHPGPRDVPSVLESWARMVREERDLTDVGQATVFTEANVLRVHNDWICAQPWVDEYWDEIRRIYSDLRTVCGEPKPKSIGPCPNVLDYPELLGPACRVCVHDSCIDIRAPICGHPLYASPWSDTISCKGCGKDYRRHQWLSLGRAKGVVA